MYAPHKRFRRTCHVFSVIDAEIVEKGHFWPETTIHPDRRNTLKSARKPVQQEMETSVAYWLGRPLGD
jgi:hypothetical protein